MTPNEITTVIASYFGKQDDMGFRLQMFERVKGWRSRLIANSLERNPQDRVHFSQTFVVPMESGDGFSISKVEVPRPLEGSRMYYDYVGTGDGLPFIYAPAGMGDLLSAGEYSLTPTFDVSNRRLLVRREGVCKVVIRGIMDDPPQDLADCQDCDYWNAQYPLSYKIAQQIITYITHEDYKTTAPGDKTGDLAVPATDGRV